MSRITTEAEGIARMTDHFARGNMSGQYPIWTARKAAALTVAQMAPGAEIRNVLDLGIGDLSVMAAWGGFRGLSHYHGVDGTPAVISGAAEKLAQLRAAGGDREKAGWLPWNQVAGELD